MRLKNHVEQLHYIMAYDDFVKNNQLSIEAQLLEIQRFVGSKNLWKELLDYLYKNVG